MNKKNKIVVYTAIVNNYDTLKEPREVSPNCDYICFTDNLKLKSKVWQIRPLPESELDFTRQCREVKLRPHRYFPDYDYSIYIDGNVEIVGDMEELLDKYLILKGAVFTTLEHQARCCVYDEARACIEKGKDDEEIINKQVAEYKKLGFPEKYGLFETPVLIRKHNDPNVIQVMEEWWQEVSHKSKRDQLSLDFVLWKNKLRRQTFGKINESSFLTYFSKKKHKQKGLRRVRQVIIEKKDKNVFWKVIFLTAKSINRLWKKSRI